MAQVVAAAKSTTMTTSSYGQSRKALSKITHIELSHAITSEVPIARLDASAGGFVWVDHTRPSTILV